MLKLILLSREIQNNGTAYVGQDLFLVGYGHDSIKSIGLRVKAFLNIEIVIPEYGLISIGIQASFNGLLAHKHLIERGEALLSIEDEPVWRNIIRTFYTSKPATLETHGIAVPFKEHRCTHRETGSYTLNELAYLGVIPDPAALEFGELCFTLANPRQEFAEFLIV